MSNPDLGLVERKSGGGGNRTRARFLPKRTTREYLKGLVCGFILAGLLIAASGKAHRLSGHPSSLRGKLLLAKAQVRHDRVSRDPWLRRDMRYVRQLQRLVAPARPVVDSCLSALIWRESRWNVHATNPRTGAYGIPQALPGSKMASAGPNWRDDAATQIRWMVGYVNARYGGSCAALSFQKGHGYY